MGREKGGKEGTGGQGRGEGGGGARRRYYFCVGVHLDTPTPPSQLMPPTELIPPTQLMPLARTKHVGLNPRSHSGRTSGTPRDPSDQVRVAFTLGTPGLLGSTLLPPAPMEASIEHPFPHTRWPHKYRIQSESGRVGADPRIRGTPILTKQQNDWICMFSSLRPAVILLEGIE